MPSWKASPVPSGTQGPRFIIVSLGNPAPYQESRHSAGHIALITLQQRLGRTQPAFKSEKVGKQRTQASFGPKHILLQSPTQMNVTGPWLARAYKDVLAREGLSPSEAYLIVIHDEMESDVGALKLREWNHSSRGHNGVKSIQNALRPNNKGPAEHWIRFSVGIGRPAQRDSATVSHWVLQPLDGACKRLIRSQWVGELENELSGIEERWSEEIQSSEGEA